ncbi:MAG: cupin domain-containing protein [Gammaproteobacteria bacterium]
MPSKVVSLSEARRMGPPAAGRLAVSVFDHGTLEVLVYEPRGVDRQTPHERDEIYVVATGSARFVDAAAATDVAAGAFIFVAAGETHRFEDMSEDFCAWVAFYGPAGGEGTEQEGGEAPGASP